MPNLPPHLVTADILGYVVELGGTDNIEAAFEVLGKYVDKFGFDAISYSAIPRSLGIAERFAPVFLATENFSIGFLQQYAEESLWRSDFAIERIMDGHMNPLDWVQELKTGQLAANQQGVIELANVDYGIRNAVTIPTQSDLHIVAGASVISSESNRVFTQLSKNRLAQTCFLVEHFHNLVFSRVPNRVLFYRPVLDELTAAERRVLGFVVAGKPLKQCKEFTGISPTMAGNIMSRLYRRLQVANASELAYLMGHHQILTMFE